MVNPQQRQLVKFAEQQCLESEQAKNNFVSEDSKTKEILFKKGFFCLLRYNPMKIYEKVFKVFKKNYQLVPLEVFGTNPYKTLISTLLSSRTKEETTIKASHRLFKTAPSLERLKKLKTKQIEKLIYPVSFYITKAKHLKTISNTITKVPKTKKGLIELPGVGIKTANLVLNRAFQIPAIAVDTHVHKISNLLGWVKTKTPEETEKELSIVLPKKHWKNANRFFVSIGRQHTTNKRLTEFLKREKLITSKKIQTLV